MYTVSQGGYSKNVSVVGASTKYCALLYQNTVTPAPGPRPGQPQPRQEAHLQELGIGGGHIQMIEVSKYFIRKYLAMI